MMSWVAAIVVQEAPNLAAEPEEKVGLRPSSHLPAFGVLWQQALACLSDHESCGEAEIIPGMER